MTIVSPSEEAIAKLLKKKPLATRLRTEDIQKIPVEIRERAQFSAAVEDVRTMQSVQNKVDEAVDFANKDPERAFMNRGKFVSEMRQELGAEAGDSGEITDLTSQRRLELIYNMQTQDAAEYASWKWGQDADVLDAFPAQELVRVEARRVPRGYLERKGVLVPDPDNSWPSRWEDAGGVLIEGRMVALKTDPIWEAISAFGKPFPPFDFESGMGLEDIDREEAESLGMIEPGETLEPDKGGFNDTLEAGTEQLDSHFTNLLKQWFGDKVKLTGDSAKWQE